MLLIVALPLTGNWISHSANTKMDFTVKGPFGSVHGNFTGLKATITLDKKDLSASSVIASIDTKTISTGISIRNNHLRSKDEWFNTNKYPQVTFTSTKIEKTDKGFKALATSH